MKLTKFFLATTLIASTLHSQAQTQDRQVAPTAQQLVEIKTQEETTAVQRQKNPNSGVFNNFLGQTRICIQPVNPDVATNVNVYTYTPPDLIFHPTGYMSIIPSTMGRFMQANGNDPITGQTIYSPVPTNSLNSSGQFFTQTTGRAHIQWTQPGWAQVKQWYGNNSTRTLYVFVNDPSENSSLADFTATKQDNCANPLGFTITRTSWAQLRSVAIVVTEVDNVSGNPVSGGYQWTYTEGLGGNWIGGTKTFTNGMTGSNIFVPLALQSGKSYNVSLTAESNCGTTTKTTKLTYPSCQPTTSVFTVVGEQESNYTKVPACVSSVMVNNTTTSPAGAGAISQLYLTLQATSDLNCANTFGIVQPANIPGNPSMIDIKAISGFTQMLNTVGSYKLTMAAQNNAGYGPTQSRCIKVYGADPSIAGFKFICSQQIAASGSVDPSSSPDGAMIGQNSAGMYMADYTTNPNSVDSYQVEIWETNPTSGAIVQPIFNSGVVTVSLPNLPLPINYTFADKYMGPTGQTAVQGYFQGLNQTMVTAKRYKVRYTVVNECGPSSVESFFKFKPNCQFCRADENGNFIEEENDAMLRQGKQDAVFQVSVSPNPVQSELQFNFTGEVGIIAQLKIMDAQGRILSTMQNINVEGNSLSPISVAALPAGLYYYSVTTDKGVQSGKFIKQ